MRDVQLELAPGHDTHLQSVADLVYVVWFERIGAKGAGAEAMTQLCRKADQLDVAIELSIRPKETNVLAPYYAQFGFHDVSDDNSYEYHVMRRASPSWELAHRTTVTYPFEP